MTTAQDGGKVVSPTHRPPLPPGNASGTHFCYRLSRPLGHSAIGRIMSMKNSNDTIWNRTSYLNDKIDIDEITALSLQVWEWILACENACPTVWRHSTCFVRRGGRMGVQLRMQNVQGSNVGPEACYSEVLSWFPPSPPGTSRHPLICHPTTLV